MSDTIEIKKGRGARVLAILALLVGMGGVGYYAWSWNYYYRMAPERVGRDMTFMWQWKMYADGMKAAYEKDTYGGETPEETLRLFVDALKAGDIELASKYYIPEKQAEVYGELIKGKDVGNLDFITEQYSSTTLGKFIDDGEIYSISVSENNKFMFYIRFVSNPISKKWKISEP